MEQSKFSCKLFTWIGLVALITIPVIILVKKFIDDKTAKYYENEELNIFKDELDI